MKNNAKRLDIAGTTYGRLTAIRRHSKTNGGRWKWLCDCSCGQQYVVSVSDLRGGKTTSCGCRRSEGDLRRQHGMHGTRTYNTWMSMRERCRSDRHKDWRYYGGKGIRVCERWNTFENFLADMGRRPPGRTIDRIDGDGNYEPGNCRWATATEQSQNRKFKRARPRQVR